MSECADDKDVARMMGILRALNAHDPLALNQRLKTESLEIAARRIVDLYSVNASEEQIIVALSKMHAERGGPIHFRTIAQSKAELDKKWRVTARRYTSPGRIALKDKKRIEYA